MESKDLVLVKQFKTVVTCAAFLGLGICRTIQGPSMLDLQEQTHLRPSDFQWIFMLCSISFPLGNFLGGLMIDRCPPYLFMASVTFFLGIFFALIPFSSGLLSLSSFAVTAEFFMGLIDTGSNVSILRLWNDIKGPIYFSCLHFSFGVGNLLGPIMAELILESSSDKSSNNTSDVSASPIIQPEMDQVEYDTWISLLKSKPISRLQIIHIVITAFLMMTFFMFLVCAGLPDDDGKQDDTKTETEDSKETKNKPLDKSLMLRFGFVICMTLLFAIANGINFAYSNFITFFAVTSDLSLDKSQGARTTAIFFGCSALMKFVSIGLLKVLLKPVHLLIFNVTILTLASALLMTKGQDDLAIFQSGTALAGIGISTLFPIGVAWAQGQCTLGSKSMTSFIISTSIGAQIVKIPVAGFIEEYPMTLMVVLLVCTVGIALFAMVAKIFSVLAEYYYNLEELQEDFNHNPIAIESGIDSEKASLNP